jgi:hypothetical protein
MRWVTPPTPGALAPVQVILSWSIITYSAPCAPLAGTPQLHRPAVYMRCLRCAGAPRRPASGSELSLHIPSRHAALYDPGESDTDKFQSSGVDIGLRRRHTASALPISPQSVSRGRKLSRLPGSHICYGLPVCSPPCTDLTGSLRPSGTFTSGLPADRSPFPLPDMTTTATGLLCWPGLSPAGIAASFAAHADVSIALPKIPQGGFSPLRLQSWLVR